VKAQGALPEGRLIAVTGLLGSWPLREASLPLAHPVSATRRSVTMRHRVETLSSARSKIPNPSYFQYPSGRIVTLRETTARMLLDVAAPAPTLRTGIPVEGSISPLAVEPVEA
jgi:hypothetical protein